MIEELKPYIIDIVKDILPNGTIKTTSGKKEYWHRCPFHEDKNPSFSINLENGLSYCFGCGYSGDIIDVYAKVKGLNAKEAVKELFKSYLPQNIGTKENQSTIEKATYMWNNSVKNSETIKKYLKSRGVTKSYDLRLYKDNIMLARVVDIHDNLKTLHMTILENTNDGKVVKKEKKFLKGLPSKGYSVHFGEPLDSLALVEGIETALSIKEALPILPIWATLSASNMPDVEIPLGIRNVYIFYDKDKSDTGYKAALENAKKLLKENKGIHVYLIPPPMDIPENSKGVDFNDVLLKKGKEAVVLSFKEAKEFEDKDSDKISPIDLALSLVKEKTKFFRSKDGESYAKVKIKKDRDKDKDDQKNESHIEIMQIRSKEFKKFISSIYYRTTKKVLYPKVADNVIFTLDSIISNESKEEDVFYRVAYYNGNIYIDLADEKWRVIEITPNSWRILDKSPVNFIRYASTLSLPEPKESGNVNRLKEFLNIDDEGFNVIVGFLLNVLSPNENHIGMILTGEQGSTKSTMAKMIKSVVDPDIKQKLSTLKSEEDLIIAASRSKVVVVDNISKCSQNFSDSLCRLLDSSSISKRRLFTDYEEAILTAASSVILTAISNVFVYQDLLDRVVMINLKPVDPKQRKEEKKLFEDFEKEHPYILGALCDMVSEGLRNINRVNLKEKPRRADFAVWLAACEYESKEKRLLNSYLKNIEKIIDASLADDALVSTFMSWFEDKDSWKGSATELMNILINFADKEVKAELPKASNKFSQRLMMAASFLRRKKIDIKKRTYQKGKFDNYQKTD
ncbi:toprim domain-containing protein [Hippea alviniae]|uniref:toprim domain-containing protein n=1 Tax=Hippea alviniae TaxID=1279027 RepID=UPI0003B437EF|nr:toprim domain-containing protein [Hippea alviniae]